MWEREVYSKSGAFPNLLSEAGQNRCIPAGVTASMGNSVCNSSAYWEPNWHHSATLQKLISAQAEGDGKQICDMPAHMSGCCQAG